MKIFILILLAISQAHAASVLFIGDSHSVGPFGWEMDRLIRTIPGVTQTASYASCGSIAQWWVTGKSTPCGYWEHQGHQAAISLKTGPTPIFSDLLQKHKPSVVVVELSGNYMGYSDSFSVDDMRAMAQKIKAIGAKCLWISTPKTRVNPDRILRLVPLVHEAVGDVCEVFESHLVTEYPATGGDGTHYWFAAGIPIAKSWAKAASLRLEALFFP
ncbi:MAG: hypothetical protein K2P81_16535 [Bacteriovoracaceae bacterium]|nr:hypothetical protein [Bacteriovoracaceae bacterium]